VIDIDTIQFYRRSPITVNSVEITVYGKERFFVGEVMAISSRSNCVFYVDDGLNSAVWNASVVALENSSCRVCNLQEHLVSGDRQTARTLLKVCT
jgi:hypothetical protein